MRRLKRLGRLLVMLAVKWTSSNVKVWWSQVSLFNLPGFVDRRLIFSKILAEYQLKVSQHKWQFNKNGGTRR